MFTIQPESYLRLLAKSGIDCGELPSVEPQSILGSLGTGSCCSLCKKQIRDDEIEYEFSMPWGVKVANFRFHLACELAWSLVCLERQIHLT